MFTGIIQEVGVITTLDSRGDWVATISAPQTVKTLKIGASVACAGVCLTVVNVLDRAFVIQISEETRSKTTAGKWQVGTQINLERALCVGDELGGHLVSGHVDGIATVISRLQENDSLRFQFQVPEALAPFIAQKGSVALDGVSLTVNEVEGSIFGVNVIPHTQTMTTLSALHAGDCLNIEVDLLARYLARMLETRGK